MTDKRLIKFDTSNIDTCQAGFIFSIGEKDGETIIKSLEFEKDAKGCLGHPKTIAALVKNTPINKIDIDALLDTTCFRKKSCGMMLASYIEAIKNGEY